MEKQAFSDFSENLVTKQKYCFQRVGVQKLNTTLSIVKQ